MVRVWIRRREQLCYGGGVMFRPNRQRWRFVEYCRLGLGY